MAAATEEEHAAASIRPHAAAPRRIFVVANNIDELGGLQQVAHQLADGFSRRGHEVDLIGITKATEPHVYRPADATYRTHLVYEDGTNPDLRPVRSRGRLDLPNRLRARRRRRVLRRGVARLEQLFATGPDAIVV